MTTKLSLPIANAAAAPAAPSNLKTRAQGGDVMSELAYEVATNKVVIYMKGTPAMPQCGFSARAAQILSSFNVPYHAVNILADPEKRQSIKDFSNWPTLPQIYVNGEFIGGSDILLEMYQNGELKELITKAFA
jgi:monothiol glutaredoxin